MPSDVRVVGYSVDKKTGDVSFCYEARVNGRTDDAAGEAALAYVEALGAGTGAYGGEANPLQEAQFQVGMRRSHRVALLRCHEGIFSRAAARSTQTPPPAHGKVAVAVAAVLSS